MRDVASLDQFAQLADFVQDVLAARQRVQHPSLAALDAPRDRHLAGAGQQGHRAHLAQVHAYRIVGLFQQVVGAFPPGILLSLGRPGGLGLDVLGLGLDDLDAQGL